MTAVMALLGLAMASALLVQYLRVPYTVVLVLIGLLVGATGIRPDFSLDRDLLLNVFLPLLLFEGALHVDLRVLRDTWLPIAALAIPGVIVSTLLIALGLHVLIGVGFGAAAVFGALVSATDPVAVLATFKRLQMPRKLAMLIEGESVVNDATALVLLSVLLPVARGGSFNVALISLRFVGVLAGGIVVGGAIGWLGSRLVGLVHEHLAELTLSALIAYGSFLLADKAHVSGVIATVTAGLIFASRGRAGLTEPAENLLADVWEFAAFLANSLLFLLIGLKVRLNDLASVSTDVAWAVVTTTLARALVVYGFGFVLGWARRPFLRRHSHLVFWSGLRGALTLVLALSLPSDLKEHEQLLQLAVGVVLFTLLVQGLSLGPLSRRSGPRGAWNG